MNGGHNVWESWEGPELAEAAVRGVYLRPLMASGWVVWVELAGDGTPPRRVELQDGRGAPILVVEAVRPRRRGWRVRLVPLAPMPTSNAGFTPRLRVDMGENESTTLRVRSGDDAPGSLGASVRPDALELAAAARRSGGVVVVIDGVAVVDAYPSDFVVRPSGALLAPDLQCANCAPGISTDDELAAWLAAGPPHHDTAYHHGPYSWVWSHDVRCDVDGGGCLFLAACSRCRTYLVRHGTDREGWNRFVAEHSHGARRPTPRRLRRDTARARRRGEALARRARRGFARW